MAAKDDKAPIIIKRGKKVVHPHHGGAWKVAYADFVTAMMAFFLLLWLLQVTTDDQKSGIADYFSPSSVAKSSSGAGGMLKGQSMSKQGARRSEKSPAGVVISLPPVQGLPNEEGEGDDTPGAQGDQTEYAANVDQLAVEQVDLVEIVEDATEEASELALEELLAAREDEQFAAAEQSLREAIESFPELEGLENNLLIDQTSEGMRIQIVDQENQSMFPTGSSKMYDHTKQLLALIVGAVRQMPQQVAIKGHTDSVPYANTEGYSNWELSTDRANASRRALVGAGLPASRIESVVGLADKEHLDEDNPLSPQNRRISIILLRETALPTGAKTKNPQQAAKPDNNSQHP